MFQYAAALAVALRNQRPLYLDPFTGFARDFYERSFKLAAYNISAVVAEPNECEELMRKTKLLRRFQRLREKFRQEWLGRNFDPTVHRRKVSGELVMEGFWHSEDYFLDVADCVRKEFTLRSPLSAETLAIARELNGAPDSLSIHVRKLHGYSATGKVVSEIAYTCGREYYTRAVEYIQSRAGRTTAYVFVDGPTSPDELKLPCPYRLVSHNGVDRDYEDLYLMSLCRHHIIANSTFSWWAAWLGNQPDGLVCAPENFYPHQHKRRPLRDVYPAHWIIV